MAHYIKQLGDRLRDEIRNVVAQTEYGFPFNQHEAQWGDALGSIDDELKKLDVMLLAPDVRAPFILTRDLLRAGPHMQSIYLNDPKAAWETIAKGLEEMGQHLETYGQAVVSGRSFGWLIDPDLKKIIERDYAEVVVKLFPSGAWKSTVIMAGSVAEAILFDVLTGSVTRLARSQRSQEVPRNRAGTPVPHEDWKLYALLKLARDVGLFDQNREDTFDVSLREFRNFVHPKKEIRDAHPCGEGEAYSAVGALISLCDHFDKKPPAA